MHDLKKTDVFKPQSRDWHRKALVGSYFSDDLGSYVNGYYRAANIVVDLTSVNHQTSLYLLFAFCIVTSLKML